MFDALPYYAVMKLLIKFTPLANLILIAGFSIANTSCKKDDTTQVTLSKPSSEIILASTPADSVDQVQLAANAAKSIVSYYDFDDSKGTWFENSMSYPYSASQVSDIKKSGKGLKVELHKGDGYRAEYGTSFRTSTKEGWFGFSVYFPDSYVKDNSIESIVQWQAYPDFDLGENWRSAPLFLGVLNDRLILDMRNDPKKVTIQGDFAYWNRVDLGALEKNKWQDFVFHIIWAPDNTGMVQMWRNGKLVYERKNEPTSYNDVRFPYFKIGIYKWDWNPLNLLSKSTTTSRTIYVDEVRIGNEKANYKVIAPGSGTK